MKNVKEQETQEVAVKDETPKAVAVAQHYESTGFEDMTDDVSLILPIVKIMQATSPELDLEGVSFKKGDLVHSLLLEKMPDKFVPIKFFDSKVLLVPQKEDEKEALRVRLNLTTEEMSATNILCQAKDGKNGSKYGSCADCGLSKWDNESGEKPVCTHSINSMGIFIEEDGTLQDFPAVVRFANTSFKHGRKFYSMVKMGRVIYGRAYKLTTKKVENKKNNNAWYEVLAVPAGKPTEEQLPIIKEMFDDFSNAKFEMNEEIAPDIETVGEVSEY